MKTSLGYIVSFRIIWANDTRTHSFSFSMYMYFYQVSLAVWEKTPGLGSPQQIRSLKLPVACQGGHMDPIPWNLTHNHKTQLSSLSRRHHGWAEESHAPISTWDLWTLPDDLLAAKPQRRHLGQPNLLLSWHLAHLFCLETRRSFYIDVQQLYQGLS